MAHYLFIDRCSSSLFPLSSRSSPLMRALKILLCVVTGLFLSLSVSASPATPQGDAAFAARFGDGFFARYWQWNPDYAISQGYYVTADQLRPFDAHERAGYVRWLGAEIAALKRFDPAQLSPQVRADQAILENQLASERWAITDLRSWAWNPANYNVAEPIALLLNTPYAPLDVRLRTVSRRLAQVPAYYATAKANVARPTREHTALAIDQNAGVEDVLGAELESRIGESTLPKAEIDLLRKRAATARAAATDYIAFLKALDARQAHAGDARSFRLGAALYAPKFAYDIQSGDTAEVLYQRALAEKARLHARMAGIADELWPRYFPDEVPPAEPLEKIGRLIGKLSEHHTTSEGFVDEVKRQIPALEAWVRDHDLLTLDPDKPLQVRETPKYLQGVSIASISAPGPYDPAANTYYNVSPLSGYTPAQAESFLREYNDGILKVLNAHEAVPGHYVQLIYANKSPSRIKSIFGNGAMIEGWAVYSERMMLESGYGGASDPKTGPELWLLYSKWNLRVVCNTILDYGVHVLGMSEDEALKLLTHEAFQSETEARGKWRRVQLSQVQLTSYFAGYSAIWDYREKLKAELGDRFDLKRFHEAFLSYGSSPVSIIKTLMRPEDAAKP
jgi:uncharacterized protein (DUF885 family)